MPLLTVNSTCCLYYLYFQSLVHRVTFPTALKPHKFFVTLQKSNDKNDSNVSRSKDVYVKAGNDHVHMGVTVQLQATMYLSPNMYYNVSEWNGFQFYSRYLRLFLCIVLYCRRKMQHFN